MNGLHCLFQVVFTFMVSEQGSKSIVLPDSTMARGKFQLSIGVANKLEGESNYYVWNLKMKALLL